MAQLLMAIGGIIGLVFGIMILVKAFQTSVGWGLACLLVPFVSLIFVITHWEETKKPFLLGLLAIPFQVVGMMLAAP